MWDCYAQQFSTFIQDFASDDLVIVIIQFDKGSLIFKMVFFGTRMFINDDIEEIRSFRNSVMLGNGSESSSQLAGPLYLAKLCILPTRNFLRDLEESMWKISLKLQRYYRKLFVLFLEQ